MFSAAPKSSYALASHHPSGASASSVGGSIGPLGTEIVVGMKGKYSRWSIRVLHFVVSFVWVFRVSGLLTKNSRAG